MAEGIILAVDIGGTKTALMAWDMGAERELAKDRYPTPAGEHPEAMIDRLVDELKALVKRTKRTFDEVAAVGLAVPGLVDPTDGRVIAAGNLRGWRDVPVRSLLARRLGVPVWVEQDANAAVLGERWRGAAASMQNVVFLALGTGIGAGLILDGRIYRGCRHAAGEVGNFVMGRQYLGKNRRGHGNLEALVGGPTIREEAADATGDDLSAAEAIDRADGDKRLAVLAERVADHVAILVVNISALLDPEAIIFGGGTASAGSDLLEPVRERVDRELANPPALMHSVLGEDAQLYGAVWGASQAAAHRHRGTSTPPDLVPDGETAS